MSEATPSEPSEGYLRLLEAAEVLLDEHGIDGVSARAIGIAAGHKNTGAVNYHFGERSELVRAMLARHAEMLNAQRHAVLDGLGEAPSLEDVLCAILDPLLSLLDDPSGRRYLRMLNQAAGHPRLFQYAEPSYSSSLLRAFLQIAQHFTDIPFAVFAFRARLALGMALFALAEQSRLVEGETLPRPVLPREEFAAELLAAILRLLQT